uniref:DNA-directed RNA polymerases I and III subunit RPAC1 n=2 Tax=Tetradesmus obliquus TaxID=3088 RepID=A0A383VU15_TETOB|eukprot:jgi/Sobl393_1/17113/SZX68254.1
MTKKKKEKQKLPEPLETQRNYVLCGPIVNTHTSTATSASMYMPLGVDNAWDFDDWTGHFDIQVQELSPERLVFDMIGADPALANALRRILISEVPTVAIEHVFIVNNTSIIQDEVLSHRLGLVPLAVDPNALAWRSGEDAAGESNSVVFKLAVRCSRAADGSMVNDKVYSRDLVWLPSGSELPDETGCRFGRSQEGMFAAPPRDVEQNILLAKLRPGQCIELEAHAVKGVGREHAKWSPVATAWYRLHPEVVLLQPVAGADAQELAAAVPGLFTVQDGQLVVGEARQHEDKLERVRRLLEQDKWAEAIQLRKRKDHFIFTIESTGCVPAEDLFRMALEILAAKCDKLAARL